MTRTELISVAKPILFNTEMVKAILDGKKTVTRRVIKPRYRDDEIGFNVVTNAHDGSFVRVEKYDEYESVFDEKGRLRIVNPPYNTGDILYVRETWSTYCRNSEECYIYKTHDRNRKILEEVGNALIKWSPSLHMPKKAARIFLKVTGVRVERLQDITKYIPGSDNPIVKEGFTYGCDFIAGWENTVPKKNRALYGWYANPWVWVIEFERLECTDELQAHK